VGDIPVKYDLIERLRAMARHEHADTSVADEAADVIERMRTRLEGDCNCPCCQQIYLCEDGCTFEEDCPNDAERMEGARDALFGMGLVGRRESKEAP
jgi:hypothetical protein